MKNKYYITTAIPYVNGSPHIGHALEFVQTDVLARAHRLQSDDTYFLTGTDDNSLKNVQAAEKAGMPTAEFVDAGAAVFEDLAKKLSISNDQFIRTASDAHFKGAQKLWASCKSEDIYKKKYKGLYCVGCEVFYTPDELVDGKCAEHQTVPEEVEEENYFFKLSNYQKKLEELIESDTYKISPQSRKNEVLSFIRMGLEDFSISRSSERAKNWGVPVPGDGSQIMYVWFDALSNYITALGYGDDGPNFKKFWSENDSKVHVIGKGIIRFHAIYWPAMLLSAGIPLPNELFVHGYINVEGSKMSKSIGNVVDPFELIQKYGAEAVRFYLLKHVHPFEDSDYSEARFIEAFNADLANGLGNLVSRVTNMVSQIGGEAGQKTLQGLGGRYIDADLENRLKPYIDDYLFSDAMKLIWLKISECDGIIEKKKPWQIKNDDEKKTVLQDLTCRIYDIVLALRPFMPETSASILSMITADTIVKATPLFGKLNV